MRFSIVSFFVCLLLIASLSLNWYLIQHNGLDGLKKTLGVDFELPEFFSERISKPQPEAVLEETIVKAEPTHQITVDETLSNLHKLFKANDFDKAWLGLSQSNHEGISKLKKDWIKACTNWLNKDPRNPNIDRFIDAGLKFLPGDFELRQLNPQRMLARQQYIKAIDELYTLLAESDVILENELDSQITRIREQRIKQLTDQKEWQELFDFTERLLWHDKTNAALTFIHAQALANLERYSEAKSKLYYIANDIKYGAKAKILIDKIDQSLLDERLDRKAITLSTNGSHHIVSGLIDNYVPVNLMIDTGASLTTISESIFNVIQQNSNAVFIREQQFNTAGGLITASVYRVSSFRVDDYEVTNIDLAVMDLDIGSDSDGLLGMNFLSHFDFKIDQQQNALILAPRN